MEPVIPLIAATGWAAGVNAYATVALLCIAGRTDLLAVPHTFERTDVLVVSLVLFALEFVADKVPLVDSGWDVVQTVARPLVGGTVGALLAGGHGADSLLQTGAFGGSGGHRAGQPLGQGKHPAGREHLARAALEHRA